MTIERGTALVRRWAPKFGLADCRIHTQPMREEEAKDALAQSWFDPEEGWGIIWLPEDDSMSPELLELTVLHELAHGLLWHCDHPSPNVGTLVERFCNRVARLARGDFASPDAAEAAALADPEKFFADKNEPASYERRMWLNVVCDGLPEREREVIAALFYEGASLREVAKRYGVHHRTVERIRDDATARMRAYFFGLDARFMEDASPLREDATDGAEAL